MLLILGLPLTSGGNPHSDLNMDQRPSGTMVVHVDNLSVLLKVLLFVCFVLANFIPSWSYLM